jgi:hypothetical protein
MPQVRLVVMAKGKGSKQLRRGDGYSMDGGPGVGATASWRLASVEAKACVEAALAQLDQEPQSLRALWAVDFFAPLVTEQLPPTAALARERFSAMRAGVTSEAWRERLFAVGVSDFLAERFLDLLQTHDEGPGLLVLVDGLISSTPDPQRLTNLAYANSNYHGGWHAAAKYEILAAERLARAALAIDPGLPRARALYFDRSFLERFNRAAGHPELVGAPVPEEPPEVHATRIRDAVHAMGLPGFMAKYGELSDVIESTPVEHALVIDALAEGLRVQEYRARKCCAEALGRATVEQERVAALLLATLQGPIADPLYRQEELAGGGVRRFADGGSSAEEAAAASLVLLGRHAVSTLPRLLDVIEATPHFDPWEHRYHADALLTLCAHAQGEVRTRAEHVVAAISRRDLGTDYSEFRKRARKLGIA